MDLLRKLRVEASRYLVESSDWLKTNKDAHRLHANVLIDVETFADQVVRTCDQLIESLDPLFSRLDSASNEQLDAAIGLLARQTRIEPERLDTLVRSFVGIVGNKNAANVRYNYVETTTSAGSKRQNVDANFALLREKREWDDIDALITKSIMPDRSIDLRNLLDLNDYQLQLLTAYMNKTNATLFDLLFNPAVTIEYSPLLVRALAAREIGVDELSRFFEWVGERSVVLRVSANAHEEKVKAEMERYRRLIDEAERVYEASVEKEKQSRATYEELKRTKRELEERLRAIERETTELKNSSKFLGDSERIADYYTKLEQRYITNVVDHLSDIKSTELSTEQDLAPIKRLGFQTDEIQRLNDDYREYRIILYNYLRRLLL